MIARPVERALVTAMVALGLSTRVQRFGKRNRSRRCLQAFSLVVTDGFLNVLIPAVAEFL